jgi:hypothetical protein
MRLRLAYNAREQSQRRKCRQCGREVDYNVEMDAYDFPVVGKIKDTICEVCYVSRATTEEA